MLQRASVWSTQLSVCIRSYSPAGQADAALSTLTYGPTHRERDRVKECCIMFSRHAVLVALNVQPLWLPARTTIDYPLHSSRRRMKDSQSPSPPWYKVLQFLAVQLPKSPVFLEVIPHRNSFKGLQLNTLIRQAGCGGTVWSAIGAVSRVNRCLSSHKKFTGGGSGRELKWAWKVTCYHVPGVSCGPGRRCYPSPPPNHIIFPSQQSSGQLTKWPDFRCLGSTENMFI